MQHVFILLAFKALVFFPLWVEFLEYPLVIFNKWWLSLGPGHKEHVTHVIVTKKKHLQRGFTGS